MESTSQMARDRLHLLTAQMHTAVAGAVELSLQGADTLRAQHLAGNVDSVVNDIETLRRALEESSASSAGGPLGPRPRTR